MRTSRFIRRDDRSIVAGSCGTLAELARVRISLRCGKPLYLFDGMVASAGAARRWNQGELSADCAAAACYDFKVIGPPH
jgi:hypothetical protein